MSSICSAIRIALSQGASHPGDAPLFRRNSRMSFFNELDAGAVGGGRSTAAKRPPSASMQIPAFGGGGSRLAKQEDSNNFFGRLSSKPQPAAPQPPAMQQQDSDSFFASLDAKRPAEPAVNTQADDFLGAIGADGTQEPAHVGADEALEGQRRIQVFMERNDLTFSNHPRDWEHSIESAWSLSHTDPRLRRANSNTLKGIAAIIADYSRDVRWAVRCLLNPNAVSSAGQAAPATLAQHLRLDPHRDVKPCLDFLAEQRALSVVEALVQLGVPRSQLSKQFDGMSTVVTCDVVVAAAERPATLTTTTTTTSRSSTSQPFSPLRQERWHEEDKRRHEEDKRVRARAPCSAAASQTSQPYTSTACSMSCWPTPPDRLLWPPL